MALLRNKLISVFLCWLLLLQPAFAFTKPAPIRLTKEDALQGADILGIRAAVDRLLTIQAQTGGDPKNQPEETQLLKSLILRKILRGVLEIRQACNKIDFELAYAYDVMKREQRREAFIFELFNLANFAQLSTFYTLEPFVRQHNQFVMSAIFTTTSGSLGTTIATLSKLYARMAKADHVAPPKVLAHMVDGWPVDTEHMPPLVNKFLDAEAIDYKGTRREELFATWKQRYGVDASNKEELCGIKDKKRASVSLLDKRILLLWSLRTCVQDFDYDLLALLKLVKGHVAKMPGSAHSYPNSPSYNPEEVEVIRLLNIQPQVDELISLGKNNIDNARRDELNLIILERALEGSLELQAASDKVDDELNYNYHVVLSSLLASRAKWQQWIYNLNFIQTGIMGIVAGRLYLSRWSYAGDKQFVISGGIGTGLTTLSILAMHGFWRKVDTGPNSLAESLNLHPADEYRFSSFVSAFLNDTPPGSMDGKTRREILDEAWRKNRVTTMNLNSTKTLEALANMPPHKWDTIKIATNRNVLLQSLKKELESFQVEVLELLRITE